MVNKRMGKIGYAFMAIGAGLLILPLYYTIMIFTGALQPIAPFPHEPGLIDLSSLWNVMINMVVLTIMVKVGSVCLKHGARAVQSQE